MRLHAIFLAALVAAGCTRDRYPQAEAGVLDAPVVPDVVPTDDLPTDTTASDDVVQPPTEDVVPVDVPPRMTFTFVSAALAGGNDAGVQLRAVMSWHGALRGQSADGRIRFEGVIR